MKKIFKESIRTLLIIAGLFGVVALVSAWTAPTAAPPGGNVSAPLNVGNVGQSKEGGLNLNTGGAPNGLIVEKGNVGIGVTDTAGYKLKVLGQSFFGSSATFGAGLQTTSFQMNAGASPGSVLTSDVSGVATWQTPSGGAINPVYTGDKSAVTGNGRNRRTDHYELGTYTFCALTNIAFTEASSDDSLMNCWLRKEGNIWKLTTDEVLAQVICGAYCF